MVEPLDPTEATKNSTCRTPNSSFSACSVICQFTEALSTAGRHTAILSSLLTQCQASTFYHAFSHHTQRSRPPYGSCPHILAAIYGHKCLALLGRNILRLELVLGSGSSPGMVAV